MSEIVILTSLVLIIGLLGFIALMVFIIGHNLDDQVAALMGEVDAVLALVGLVRTAGDKAGLFQPFERGHCRGALPGHAIAELPL